MTIREKDHRLKYIIALLAALALVFAVGCGGGDDDVNETEISINSKGTVTHRIVESFDKPYYSEDELRGQIEDQISDYCGEKNDDKAVKLKFLEIKEGNATAELIFEDYSDYAAFNDVDFFYGTIGEALDAGYTSDVTLKSADDDETISQYEFEALKDNMIIVTSESLLIRAPGKIAYTTANIDVVDKDLARMASDSVGVGYIVLK